MTPSYRWDAGLVIAQATRICLRWVWVTKGLDDDYAFLARVEQDLRTEIESVRGSEFTPAQVGVRVRVHSGSIAGHGCQQDVGRQNRAIWPQRDGQPDVYPRRWRSGNHFPKRVGRGEFDIGHAFDLSLRGRVNRPLVRGVPGDRAHLFSENLEVCGAQRPEVAYGLEQPQCYAGMDPGKNAPGRVWNIVLAGKLCFRGAQR